MQRFLIVQYNLYVIVFPFNSFDNKILEENTGAPPASTRDLLFSSLICIIHILFILLVNLCKLIGQLKYISSFCANLSIVNFIRHYGIPWTPETAAEEGGRGERNEILCSSKILLFSLLLFLKREIEKWRVGSCYSS